MKPRLIAVYAGLFVLTFPVIAGIWHLQMAGHYFVSESRGYVLDFIPPFVTIGSEGEYYRQPVRVIYAIWSIYLAVLFVIPALGAWAFSRLYEHDLGRYW
jgi:biotin transporter BioY